VTSSSSAANVMMGLGVVGFGLFSATKYALCEENKQDDMFAFSEMLCYGGGGNNNNNNNQKCLQFVDSGTRNVTWFKISVYLVGLYIDKNDVKKRIGCLPGKDALQLIHNAENPIAIRIIPTKDATWTHLVEGYITGMNQLIEKKNSSNTNTNNNNNNNTNNTSNNTNNTSNNKIDLKKKRRRPSQMQYPSNNSYLKGINWILLERRMVVLRFILMVK